MTTYYTDEKNVQILISLLKKHNINKIVASPGTVNITFVKSLQNDSFFKIYSSVDERSAAYMAVGLAAESGDPVVLTCTGATASRNYMSGLTEAYYRKLPILAVTGTKENAKAGHHIAQVIDRSIMPKDVVKHSVELPLIKDDNDWGSCEVEANNAILELTRHGGGPVHVDLATGHNTSFKTVELPDVRVIERVETNRINYPSISYNKVAVFIGSHKKMTKSQIEALDNFCATNNAVVFCDHTSGYNGKYSVFHSLSSFQRFANFDDLSPDLLIHIGEISGDYSVNSILGEEIWRVSEDGELRDTFRKLKYVFEMPEKDFFEYYTNKKEGSNCDSYLKEWHNHLEQLRLKIPELPYSNLWIANKIHNQIPKNSTIHLGILNSLRSWNFFEISETLESASNVGGFGIDGCLSSLLGASLANENRLYFGIIGDLSFFYDMNSLGNRELGNNLRILLINNGKGTEFKNFNHIASQFGESTDKFIAAGGHYGNKSRALVKNYSENLGFEYLAASNKSEFEQVYKRFLTNEILDKPILLEVFTDSEDESNALEIITSISTTAKSKAKQKIKDIVGESNIKNIKRFLNN